MSAELFWIEVLVNLCVVVAAAAGVVAGVVAASGICAGAAGLAAAGVVAGLVVAAEAKWLLRLRQVWLQIKGDHLQKI